MKPEVIGALTIELLKGNGVVNFTVDAFEPNQRTFTLDEQSFALLCERLTALSAKDGGIDLMSFDRYEDDLPPAMEGLSLLKIAKYISQRQIEC